VPDSRESTRTTSWSAAVCAVLVAAVTVGVVASRFGWGLDRTDEGQYLTLLADPETGRSSVFLFGYVLHPLFTLLGGDILGLRIVGLAVSVLISAALGYTVARLLPIDRPATLATAAAVGAFGIGPLSFFPATPSYNTLAYWGCCLWAIGLAHTVLRRRSLLGPAVLGVGGVVAFSGKATTGAALAALTLAILAVMLTRKRRPVLPISAITTRYQITLDVFDRPGVLSRVTEVFASEQVSIELVQQTQVVDEPEGTEQRAKLVIATHSGTDAALRRTVDRLAALDVVNALTSVLRIEGH